MKQEIMICDKCKTEILHQGSRLEIFEEAFKLKVAPTDLCISCTRELLNWLKGEPIPKQATFPKFNISTSKREPNQ